MVKPQSVNTAESLTRLWIHETSRVFADRLAIDVIKLSIFII